MSPHLAGVKRTFERYREIFYEISVKRTLYEKLTKFLLTIFSLNALGLLSSLKGENYSLRYIFTYLKRCYI